MNGLEETLKIEVNVLLSEEAINLFKLKRFKIKFNIIRGVYYFTSGKIIIIINELPGLEAKHFF